VLSACQFDTTSREALMIKLETKTMTKAIERAKTIRPRVTVISASERKYAVTGSRGDIYTVTFAVTNGMKLADCDCPARALCYHIAAAASVNIAVQSMRRPSPAPSPADERQTLIADITATWSRRFPGESLADNLMARFK